MLCAIFFYRFYQRLILTMMRLFNFCSQYIFGVMQEARCHTLLEEYPRLPLFLFRKSNISQNSWQCICHIILKLSMPTLYCLFLTSSDVLFKTCSIFRLKIQVPCVRRFFEIARFFATFHQLIFIISILRAKLVHQQIKSFYFIVQ